MKIAVSANQPNLEGDLDPRFGRCNFFIIIDPDTMEFEAIENPHTKAMGGVGPDTAYLIMQQDVQAVITGSIGMNAHQALQGAGIQMFTGARGSVRDAISAYKSAQLQSASPSSEPPPTFPTWTGKGMGLGRR